MARIQTSKATQKLKEDKSEDDKYETRHFLSDRSREINLAFPLLVLVFVILLTAFVIFPSSRNSSRVPAPSPSVAAKAKDTSQISKIKVSTDSSQIEKQDINAAIGDEIDLTLIEDDSNSTWQLTQAYDHQVVKLDQIKFKDSNQYIPLSQKLEEWRLIATDVGETEIIVALRDYKGNTLKTDKFTIKVRKD